jgi:hypothetical protein
MLYDAVLSDARVREVNPSQWVLQSPVPIQIRDVCAQHEDVDRTLKRTISTTRNCDTLMRRWTSQGTLHQRCPHTTFLPPILPTQQRPK